MNQEDEREDSDSDVDDEGGKIDHHNAATIPQPVRKRKFSHRTHGTGTLASHAVTNAQERQASFYLAHKDVIDEYARLSQEIHEAKQAVVKLERALSHFVKGLKHYAQT